jgi:hypothetical protein
LTIVSLAAVLLNLSCAGTPPNNTVKSNTVNGNAAPSNTDQSNETFADVEWPEDATGKKDKINREVKEKINSEKNLRYQHNENKKNFYFEPVVDAKGVATLYIWGSIFTSSKDLNKLNETFKDVMKRKCVEKVVFTSPPDMLERAASFEFLLCEAPNQICSDGSCREYCDRKDVNANTNMNSNTNTRSNSNK